MMGPMPSAVDSINWEYAKAVAALRDSDRIASFVALGRALHILQVTRGRRIIFLLVHD
eukprot:SAG31_NODE_11981_length_980_cov_1.175936_2_plen_58_part_00